MTDINSKARLIQCLICDLDGVLTDGQVSLDNTSIEMKSFYIQDGLGLKLLMGVGIHVAVITGSNQPLIESRMRQLGIEHFFAGQTNKQHAYDTLKHRLQLTDAQFAYIGDDLPDYPIMQQVGLGVAVANAVHAVKRGADVVTQQAGGHGAVREICDLILQAQGLMEKATHHYLHS